VLGRLHISNLIKDRAKLRWESDLFFYLHRNNIALLEILLLNVYDKGEE
jgi:hypothetical protein